MPCTRHASLTSMIPALLAVMTAGPLFAQEIYKGKTQSGAPMYSSKPKGEGSAPAKLPQISKGDFKLAKAIPPNCFQHGGVNCPAGPDTDGSVVCFDDYRDAVLPFAQACQEAKLEVVEVTEPDGEGMVKVIVRNTRSAEAVETSVEFRRELEKKIKLEGPSSIQPYQMGEYVLPYQALVNKRKPPLAREFQLACRNCP